MSWLKSLIHFVIVKPVTYVVGQIKGRAAGGQVGDAAGQIATAAASAALAAYLPVINDAIDAEGTRLSGQSGVALESVRDRLMAVASQAAQRAGVPSASVTLITAAIDGIVLPDANAAVNDGVAQLVSAAKSAVASIN